MQYDASQSGRRLDQRIEHRLQIEGRTADDLEDIGGRRLLLQRFAQIFGARLHLVEQADIFDRDHGLVGEGRDQRNLLVVECLDGLASQQEHADGLLPIAQQRRCQKCTKPGPFLLFMVGVFRIGQDVLDCTVRPSISARPTRPLRPGCIRKVLLYSTQSAGKL